MALNSIGASISENSNVDFSDVTITNMPLFQGPPPGCIAVSIKDYNLDCLNDHDTFREWRKILQAAESNEPLQQAIDRVKIIYYLSKDYGDSKTRHKT